MKMKIDETKSRKPTDGLYRKRDTSILGSKFSLYSSSNKEELYHVDINKIKEFEGQARRHFDEEPIKKLANSIKEHGIRAPLTLLRRSEDILEVVSGERRLRAAKIAGLKKVPAFILDDVKKAEILSVIENVQREDLHPLEFAIACKRLLEEKVYKNISELAENIGVARTSVSESLGLVDLPLSIKEYIIQNKIDNRVILRKLKRAGSENECKKILDI